MLLDIQELHKLQLNLEPNNVVHLFLFYFSVLSHSSYPQALQNKYQIFIYLFIHSFIYFLL